MKQFFISAILIFGYATIGFTAEIGHPTAASTKTEVLDRASLFQHHQRCADAAALRMLSTDEVEICQTVFLYLKLTFVDDITPESYDLLPAAERATVNRAGYNGYLAWIGERS